MGWEREEGRGHLCYVVIRPFRGSTPYQPLLLTEQARRTQARGTVWPLGVSGLSLRVWSVRLDGDREGALHADINDDRLIVPADCPVAPGATLTGTRFGPLPVAEAEFGPARCEGAGLLRVDGFALVDGGTLLVEELRAEMERADVGDELDRLAAMVAARAGLGAEAGTGRRLALVERLRRKSEASGPRLFSVRVLKPAPTSLEPTRTLRVSKLAPCDANETYVLAIEARCRDDLVATALVDLAPGQDEALFDAGTHVTSFRYTAYCGDGTAIEAVSGSFMQEVLGQTIGRVGVDVLPSIPGAPGNPDLEHRARLVTDALGLISAGNRAGGLDVVRDIARALDTVAGPGNWKGQVRWFGNSSSNQAEVVRHIKELLENPSVVRAVLVDPFLGNDAFERVVIRQGREDLNLTVLISPGDVDPEAARLDVRGHAGLHINRLRASLERFRDRTCGEIRLVHLRRGEGFSQAFHDRYLVLLGRDDVPRAFLLSNSLNEAAGRWPYAMAELDRRTSWTVRRYVEDLLEGRDRNRALTVEQIWPAAVTQSSARAVLDRHRETVTWLAGDAARQTDWFATWPMFHFSWWWRSPSETLLSDWLAQQPWAGPDPDKAAHQAYRDHVVLRWRELPRASPREVAQMLVGLAAFDVAAGLNCFDALEPLLTETWTSDVTVAVLTILGVGPTGDWEHGRQEADILFEPGPILPWTFAAAMRAPRRFAEPGATMLLILLLRLDASEAAEFLAGSGTPPHLRLAAMTAAFYLCIALNDAALAGRLASARSPGLRMFALMTFEVEQQQWSPHESALATAAGLERLTLLAAAVTGSLVRASGRSMRNVPDEHYEAEKARRDSEHSTSIAALAEGWPDEVDQSIAVRLAWAGIWERLDTGAGLSDALRKASRSEAADALDDLAAQEVLELLLSPAKRVGANGPPSLAILHCAGALRRTGRSLAARRKKPTDFVRNELNPLVSEWLGALEANILDGQDEFGAVLGCLSVSVIAFEIAISATGVSARHRAGLASDHVRAVARALRSAAAIDLLGPPDGEQRGWDVILDDALALLSEVAVIEGVGEALGSLRADPDIPAQFKERTLQRAPQG